jgi:uncharacterized protein
MTRVLLALVLSLALLVPAGSALAVAAQDFPAQAPENHLVDGADVLSRATNGELSKRLERLEQDHINANLVTLRRLDYGVDLDGFANDLLQRWLAGDDGSLLVVVETATNSAAIKADAGVQQRLPESLLESTAEETMALPLRDGDRYRQAVVDGLTRLETVLAGGEDPGPPLVAETQVLVSNVPTKEETAESKAWVWITVLMVLGTLVPMATWWVFSR